MTKEAPDFCVQDSHTLEGEISPPLSPLLSPPPQYAPIIIIIIIIIQDMRHRKVNTLHYMLSK